MSKIKKSISLALALLMLLSVFTVVPITAGAETYKNGDWEYIIFEDSDNIRIERYTGTENEIVIPSTLDGHTVSSIGSKNSESVFENRKSLKSVDIPNTVTRLEYHSFQDCENLTTVSIPNSVEYIEPYAFSGCTSLPSIKIPNNVGRIDHNAFENCSSLEEINIPDSVIAIDSEAFKGCSNLSKVTIGNDVSNIYEYAFYNCNNLKSIVIPKNVDNIDICAFGYYSSETSDFEKTEGFQISGFTGSEAERYSKNNNLDFISLGVIQSELKPDYDYYLLDNGTAEILDYQGPFVPEISIPDKIDGYTVSSLRCGLFLGYDIIEIINIPDCVTEIEPGTLDCKRLKTINVSPANTHFASFEGNLYNKNLTEILQYSLGNNETEFTIPSSVKTIGYSSFSSSKLKTINLSDNVTEIGSYAFCNCVEIESINLPEKLETISYHAFSACSNLNELTIPKSVTEIGFHACGYKNVVSPNKKEDFKIYGYKGTAAETYANDNGFEFIALDETPTTEPAQTKPDVKQQNPVQVSAEDVNIDLSEYDGNDAQVYPLTVTDAQGEVVYSMVSGDEEFFSVNESTGALIISAETEEGEYTVKIKTGALGNENYNSKYITKTITVYVENNQVAPPETDNILISGDYKYRILSDGTAEITQYIGSDANVEIPETIDGKAITSIDFYAFGECTNIESVKIPENVKYIDWHAFYGCTKLNNITIPDTVISIDNGAFDDTAYVKNESNRENGLLYIGKHLIDGRNVSGECIIKDNTITVSDRAFIYNTNITRVTFPESLKRIGSQAFNGCEELREVILPENIQEIGNLAFAGCTGLTEVILPKDIKEIGDVAFGFYPFYPGGDRVQYYTIDGFKIYGYKGTAAETYAKDNGFEFIDLDNPIVTEPIATEPVTSPVVTEPTQPNVPKPTTSKVTNKKDNPIKVTVKAKTVKLKKLKKKAQKVKAITVKNNQGKVTYKLVKSGITKKIRKLVKINSKGIITIKKWKKAKKGTYKIKVKITAAGNSAYNAKSITKTIKVKIK